MRHEKYMRLAIEQALKGQGETYTNPIVGAVIVKDNVVLGKGYHTHYGAAHAEVQAIDSLTSLEESIQATLYVTLEPCAHTGKTPPCVERIIAGGFKQVVIGQRDPNPLVAGRGVALLQAAGIEVIENILRDEAYRINLIYNHFHETKLPYVTLKYTSSLDGKIAAKRGVRTNLSGSETWQDVQIEREKYQAILVGSETALVDNPSLTVRNPQGKQGLTRIIIDRSGRLTGKLMLFTDTSQPTWVFTENSNLKQRLTHQHVRLFFAELWTIEQILMVIAQEGIQSVFVEGGAKILHAFINGGYYQQLLSYVTPHLLGSEGVDAIGGAIVQQPNLKLISMEQLGTDFKLQWLPQEKGG